MIPTKTPGADYRPYLITCEETGTRTSLLGLPHKGGYDFVRLRAAKVIAVEAAPTLLAWPDRPFTDKFFTDEPFMWTSGVLAVENPHGDVYRFALEPELVHTPAQGPAGVGVAPPLWALAWALEVIE